MKQWEVRLELIYYTMVEETAHDYANEKAKEFLLDELSDPKQKGDWMRLIEAEAREI
jgi:hypothetical protein